MIDNKCMPVAPIGFVHQNQLDHEVDKAVAKLSKQEVDRVRYNVGVDSTGELAIFFRIVLTDAASKADVLAEVTDHVSAILFNELHPYENWGIIRTSIFAASLSRTSGTSRSGPKPWPTPKIFWIKP